MERMVEQRVGWHVEREDFIDGSTKAESVEGRPPVSSSMSSRSSCGAGAARPWWRARAWTASEWARSNKIANPAQVCAAVGGHFAGNTHEVRAVDSPARAPC